MKKSKKLRRGLAAFMALTMALTSLGVGVISAAAANDLDLVAAKSAITAYESKMNGTKIYTNMATAYEAYLTAQKYVDAYSYGGQTDVDLDGAADALVAATANMKEWTPYTGTAQPSWPDSPVTSEGYANVAYSDNDQTDPAWFDQGYVNWKFFTVKNIVLLYDGKTTPSYPITVETKKKGLYSQQIKYAYPSGNPFELRKNWIGYLDALWRTWPSDSDCSDDQFGYASDHEQLTKDKQGNTTTSRFWKNTVYYTGTGNTDSYYETYNSTTWNIRTTDGGYGGKNYSYNVSVINYKPIVDAVDAADCTITNHKQGGMEDIFAAYDTVTSLNPNTYNYANDIQGNVQQCATDIKNAVAGLNSATVGATDKPEYDNLRGAIDDTRATFNAGNFDDEGNQHYTTETWSAFDTAYKAAQSMMRTDSTYTGTGTDLANKAATLITTEAALQCTHSKTVLVGQRNANCQVQGYTGDTCCGWEDCGEVLETGQAIPFTGHAYKLSNIATDNMATFVCVVNSAHTKITNVDMSVYLKLEALYESIDKNKYEDLTELNAAETAFEQIRNSTMNYTNTDDAQKDVDAKITSFLTAINTVNADESNLTNYTVKVFVNGDEDTALAASFMATPIRYNEVRTFTYTGAGVVKDWLVKEGTNEASPTNVSDDGKSMDYAVTKSSGTVEIYLTVIEPEGNNTVLLQGKHDRIFDMEYIPAGSTIIATTKDGKDVLKIGDTPAIVAPTAPKDSTLRYWIINGEKVNVGSSITMGSESVIVAVPHYFAKETYKVEVKDATNDKVTAYQDINHNTISTKDGVKQQGKSVEVAYRQAITLESKNADFYAWAIDAGDTVYKVVSYEPIYDCVAEGNTTYVVITKGTAALRNMEYKPQIRLREASAAKQGEGSHNGVFFGFTDSTLTSMVIFGQLVTKNKEDDHYTVQDCGVLAYTADDGKTDFKIGDNNTKQMPAPNRLDSGQFSITVKKNVAAYTSFNIRGYVTYSYDYQYTNQEGQVVTATITVTDYTDTVKAI